MVKLLKFVFCVIPMTVLDPPGLINKNYYVNKPNCCNRVVQGTI